MPVVIYSLIQTAKANGLEPYIYLRYLFENLVVMDNITESDEEFAKLSPHQIPGTTLETYENTPV